MTRRIFTGLLLASISQSGALAATDNFWVPAWGSAQILVADADADKIGAVGPATIRQIVHLSAAGTRVRVRLSNVAGDRPLAIGAASVAATAGHGRPDSATPHRLTFAGAPTVTIPAGAEVYSDPVDAAVDTGGDLAISLFLPEPVPHRTGHPGARATAFLAPADQTRASALTGAQQIGGWWSLADVEVAGSPQDAAVVAIGDSITDGHGIRDDSNRRWPDLLAHRLASHAATRHLSVINAGIGGNRVLLDGIGPDLVARFDRDVIARAGVRYAIVLEGVNDLGMLTRDHPVDAATHRATVAAITAAYRQVAMRAHAHGIRLIGGTITPFVGNDYYHPDAAGEADRQAINDFIRSSGVFDGVIDFDAAVRDPAHPDRLLPAADSGDHLHPGEHGYAMMADAIPLSLFDGDPTPGTRSTIGAVVPPPPVGSARPMIALTFDDMPAHGPLPQGGDRLAIAQAIVAALRAHHAPAFGFFNGGFATDPSAPAVLAAWRGAGLPIGNHSWSHGNMDAATAPAFLADIARNEPVLAAANRGTDWRWFRYPFLSEGADPAKREAVRTGLRAGGYRIAAVTMSFGDYAWNDAYARCVGKRDERAIGTLEASFLAAARAQALRSRTLSQEAFGRDIPYVLLMHLGAFDARMLPRLLDLYQELGFGFTTLARTEADPVYANAVDLRLPGPTVSLEAAAAAKHLAVPPAYPLPGADLCG